MEPLVRADRVTWSNRHGRTVGAIGNVRVVLAGSPRIPPGLPRLAGFPPHESGPVACLYASPYDLDAEHCSIAIYLRGPADAHGHAMDVGRFAVVKVLDPPSRARSYTDMEDALEAALAILERQGAALA
jgi:hypothetical protein